jgi:hypothetical protein
VNTFTPTSSRTPTPVPSNTPLPTSTASRTATATATSTVANTFTFTYTGTITPINTDTPSATPTITDTPNPPTLTVSVDSNSPANSIRQPGAADVAVLEVQVSNPSSLAATLTGLTLTAAGNGVDDVGIDAVAVWLDVDGNGVIDGTDSQLGSGSYPANNGSTVIAFTLVVNAGGTVHLLVLDDFTATAPDGTYQVNINAGGLSGASTSGAVLVTGLPATGAIITITHATATTTSSPTAIPSATPTSTFTISYTSTKTFTPTPTGTLAPTTTPSFTPMPPTLSVSVGSNSPGNSNEQPGASNVDVFQVRVTNSSSIQVTLTGLTLAASGTGDDNSGIGSVMIYVDNNADGVLEGSDTYLGTSAYSLDNGTISFGFNSSVPAGTSVNYLVVDNFSTAAPDGTYVAGVNAGGLSGSCAYGSVQFSGLPVSGATITIAHATYTPTVTSTPTETALPNTSTLVVYPNPADGTQPVSIHVPGRTEKSAVMVQIFTVAFRLVRQLEPPQTLVGADVKIDLKDKNGTPLASGLYYVVVTVDSERSVGKLLILK